MEGDLDCQKTEEHDTSWDELKPERYPPNIRSTMNMDTDADYLTPMKEIISQLSLWKMLTIDEV